MKPDLHEIQEYFIRHGRHKTLAWLTTDHKWTWDDAFLVVDSLK